MFSVYHKYKSGQERAKKETYWSLFSILKTCPRYNPRTTPAELYPL